MRRATVMEGMIPAPTNRNPELLAVRNAQELVNERRVTATHLVLCSGDVWNNKCTDVLSTERKKGTMFGCTSPGVPRTSSDMSFEAAYTTLLAKELKSYGAFLESLSRRPEQTTDAMALEDEAF